MLIETLKNEMEDTNGIVDIVSSTVDNSERKLENANDAIDDVSGHRIAQFHLQAHISLVIFELKFLNNLVFSFHYFEVHLIIVHDS